MCCFLFFLLGSVSGIFSLPSSFFAWVRSVISTGGCRSLPLSLFFFSFGLPVLFVAFCTFCPLPFFPFLLEVLGSFPSLVRGFSLLRVSSLVLCLSTLGPFGFRVSSLDSVLFLCSLLRLSCASSRLACFALGPFLSLLVLGSSFLFLSPSLRLVFLLPSCAILPRMSSFWCLSPLLVGSESSCCFFIWC